MQQQYLFMNQLAQKSIQKYTTLFSLFRPLSKTAILNALVLKNCKRA